MTNNGEELKEIRLYAYEASMYEDLHEAIDEYMGESEHNGFDGFSVGSSEVSSEEQKQKLAKIVLWRDFGLYLQQSADELEEEMSKKE